MSDGRVEETTATETTATGGGRVGRYVSGVTRSWRVAVAFALPVALVLAVLFTRTPTYRATGVVRLAPGATPEESTLPVAQRADVVEGELAVADGPEARALFDDFLDFGFDYTVEADAPTASLRFEATASSPQEALTAAETATSGFVFQRPSLPGADVAPAATVSRPPSLPTEPVSPPFVPVVLAGVALGGVLAALVLLVERRRPGARSAPERVADPPSSAARRGLQGVVGIGSVLVLVVALAGVHELWEVRRTTDGQVEAMIGCIPGWLDEIPDGASIYPQPDAPEVRSEFWLVRLTELAFPRLRVAADPAEADVTVKIVLVGQGGREPCAGYEAIIAPT